MPEHKSFLVLKTHCDLLGVVQSWRPQGHLSDQIREMPGDRGLRLAFQTRRFGPRILAEPCEERQHRQCCAVLVADDVRLR